MKNLVFVLLFLITASCASKKDVSGIYKSNFADLGFFITTIELKKDSTFEYNFAGDLVNTDLTGKYRIKDKNIYLKFTKNKGDIESKSDSLSISEMLSGNYHNYNLKNESGFAYHLKYLIKGNRLFSYRIDNGKLVKFGKYYSDRKKWEKKRVYLYKKS
ncbi:hypothetical protein LUD75_14080 [Epilithonimonas sp. JDS]|uniref:hypothetical protein n=1 Tax=Epilithonimonas sp. JDS TaxID=2902797 RepID=UPI001E58FC87|nr:hypothetical protein [Epilithonimonas sp. JDS]MCD9855849.1 hypothetical protein [Epilithonimonas sp. JDS]